MVRYPGIDKAGLDGRKGCGTFTTFCCLIVSGAVGISTLYGQTEMKRNRGESFYTCQSSNTEGSGNIWLSVAGVGSVWDDVPIRTDSNGVKKPGFWVSNARAFPEVTLQDGLAEFCMLTIESRPITWAAVVPGWVSGDAKFTWPNNKSLRFLGFGVDLKYQYNFTNGPPTLGGYIGFMPEGYVAKGNVLEGRLIFDADFISKITTLPLRVLVNLGQRLPIGEYRDYYQYLVDIGAVYTGYDYDFFTTYSLEAFDNFVRPIEFTQGTKRFLVWFMENPMYLTLGGNVRYANGTKLSLAVPLLLSANVESKMSTEDLTALNHDRADLFPYEVGHGIKDPFDPWYVKWKIVVTLSFPLRYKLTSAEMMRNFLLLKNIKRQNRLDIDNRLRNFENSAFGAGTRGHRNDGGKTVAGVPEAKEQMQKQQ